MIHDYTKPPINRKYVTAKTSSGEKLYFPMKEKINSIENFKGNIIHLTDIKYTTYTELKYNTNQLINIFGVPQYKATELLGKQILEWKFIIDFKNHKVSREYQTGQFIISTSKTVDNDNEITNLLKKINDMNVNSTSPETSSKQFSSSNHTCEELEYIPLDSDSKWILEVFFNKYSFEIIDNADKNAIKMQSKKIINLIEKSLNNDLNTALMDMKI